MADHPNASTIRGAYEAFSRGDLEAVGATLDEGIVWHALGHNALSGDYKGQDEVFGFFGKLFELAGGDMNIDVHDVLANDEHGIALIKFSANKAAGESYEQNEVHVYHFENGKVTEFWAFEEDQRRSDEFFG